MTDQPVWNMSAQQLSRAYGAGVLTPETMLVQLLSHIERHNPAVNALVTIHPDVMQQARDSTARWARGQPASPIDGVPVAIKDNILTADMPTCWGTRALRDRPGQHDEVAVARLREAGVIIIGKTNVPEFTLEGYTSNSVYGTTRNPWNTQLTPGGSSGGAVAGLAAGFFPLALGTDGGGSIRRPASHTGAVGLKPSIGAVARVHTLPSLLLDFEVVGPLARTVGDLRLLFDVIRGPDVLDPLSVALDPPRQTSGLRVLYVPRFKDAPLDPAIAGSVDEAAAVFARLGHQVEVGELPVDTTAITRFWPLIGQVSLARLFADDPQIREMAGAKYQAMAAEGARVDAPEFLAGLRAVEQFRRDCADAFRHIDVVLTPAAAALPWAADQAFPPTIDGQPAGARGHAVFTGWVNASGHPGVALPCRPSPCGLPIGLQLVGARGADLQLLDLALQYETQVPWGGRVASLA